MTLVAMATRRELGDRQAEREWSEVEADRPSAAERSAKHGVTVRAELRPDGSIVLSSHLASCGVTESGGLVAGLRDTRKSTLVRWVRDSCADSRFLALDELLPAPEPGAKLELRLPADPPLAQLPWELATLRGEPVAGQPGIGALYRAPEAGAAGPDRGAALAGGVGRDRDPTGPVDGLHGPDTARSAGDFPAGPRDRRRRDRGCTDVGGAAAANSGGPRAVLVVRPDLPPPRGAIQLDEDYARSGWRVRCLRSEQLTQIGEDAASGPVDVVHVLATMQVIGSTPYLGFGAGTGAKSGPEAVTCTALDGAVRRLARFGSTPLVVLDIVGTTHSAPRPCASCCCATTSPPNCWRSASAMPVLATGLAPGQRAVEAQQRLIGAASTATTAADLAHRLRLNLTKGRGPGAELPWATTALFTAVAPDLMPALNRSSSHSR